MPVIEALGLYKTFSSKLRPEGLAGSLRSLFHTERRVVEAVKDVSFSVERGELLAFIGPNGAGKSTTIKMLTGILHPSSGAARILGMDPLRRRREVALRIGSVFGQKSQLWFHLPARDSFRLLGAIYEVEPAELSRRTAELSELFELSDILPVPVRKLSLGQRIRCEVAASLLHRPQIVFLDEPTIGLDVIAKRQIRELLTRMNKEEGVTVFLTSHDAGDIEKVCKRAIIIHHGGIVLDQSVKELKYSSLNKKIVSVKYADPVRLDIPGITISKAASCSARIEVDTRESPIAEVVKRLVAAGEVADISIEDEPLENIIAEIYRSKNRQEADDYARGL